jgi:hypothetical protein
MRKLLKLCAILIFSSCAHRVPTKPSIDICAHNLAAQQVPCVNNQTDAVKILGIDETDRFIMFHPDDWGKILLYIRVYTGDFKATKVVARTKKLSIRQAERLAKRELRKILNADFSLQKELGDGI